MAARQDRQRGGESRVKRARTSATVPVGNSKTDTAVTSPLGSAGSSLHPRSVWTSFLFLMSMTSYASVEDLLGAGACAVAACGSVTAHSSPASRTDRRAMVTGVIQPSGTAPQAGEPQPCAPWVERLCFMAYAAFPVGPRIISLK